MLINPFSYAAVSYSSPCLVVERPASGVLGYWYDTFKLNHFDAWETGLAEPVEDFDTCIAGLERDMSEYAQNTTTFLRGSATASA